MSTSTQVRCIVQRFSKRKAIRTQLTYLSVPNVNIPETETINFVRTYQEKRRQLIKKNDGHGCTMRREEGAA